MSEASARVLTEKELAAELGLSPWTVRTLRLQSGMPHFRTAGRVFYRLQSVISWMDKQEQANIKKGEQPARIGELRVIK